jgi:methylmalonyl-CoA/ethylmalonyl-CoA epimerase
MRLTQVALYAEDLGRARTFYEALLGSPPRAEFQPPGLMFFDLDGVRLLLEGNAPRSMLYLHVGDVRETVTALPDGATVVSEPHLIFRHDDDRLGPAGTEEWMAFFTDSEGNTVGLVSHHRPTEVA